jgi:hypothetical protein
MKEQATIPEMDELKQLFPEYGEELGIARLEYWTGGGGHHYQWEIYLGKRIVLSKVCGESDTLADAMAHARAYAAKT